jgi:outer membrane protein TolC
MTYSSIHTLTLAGTLLFCSATRAQAPGDTLIRLRDAVQMAEQHYHLLQAKKYEAAAAVKNVEVTRYSRLPGIDATYQAGFATANNLIGVFYPNGVLPMTGPPSASNRYDPATGSAASVLLNWQASTFGQRNAQIDVSAAEARTQGAGYTQVVFNHTIGVISKYLDVLLAQDVVNIHLHNIERVQASLKQSRVLTSTGIKPGVDTALFLSEISKARVDWLNAQKLLQTQQWLLAQLIVTDLLPVPADSNFLDRLPAESINKDAEFSSHPTIQYAQSQLLLSNARETLLKKSYLPKLTVWGTAFARGSGFLADGTIKTWDGLGLSRYNYGAGVQLAFPIMKYGEVKRQLQQQTLLTKAAEENLLENKAALSTQQRIAVTTFQNSLLVAAESRQQRQSGLYAFDAMQTRYNTGLVNFADLIQVQYNLLKAELDVKQAYWDAWKALLLQAAVKGDLTIFLNETR